MAEPPEIVTVQPVGDVIRPGWEIPVRALLRYDDGTVRDVEATATAWTRNAVEITWATSGSEPSTDWIPSDDVKPLRPRRRR